MTKYWETETPTEIIAEKNVFKYYAEANKLHVSRPAWEDSNGNMKPGKTVTLDIAALQEESADIKAAMREVLKMIITKI